MPLDRRPLSTLNAQRANLKLEVSVRIVESIPAVLGQRLGQLLNARERKRKRQLAAAS
jgi:hypothetical protein